MRIFGHRGACGYLPENTLESMWLAVEQSVDGIEFDVIPTRDGVLVVRHENELSLTTNVAELPQFADRFREGIADGKRLEGWFCEDFTAAEIAELRARERLPQYRAESANHDGRYRVPTLQQVLTDSRLAQTPLIIEVKHGDFFESIGLDTVPLVAADLEAADWRAAGREIIVESFDFDVLQRLRDAIGRPASFVFLTDHERVPGSERDLREYWVEVAAEFDGVAIDLHLLAEPGLVAQLRGLGLQVYGYTARVEFARGDVAGYHRRIFELGADAIFSDQPDQLRRDVAALL